MAAAAHLRFWCVGLETKKPGGDAGLKLFAFSNVQRRQLIATSDWIGGTAVPCMAIIC
jgi:hypothetical protein